MKAANGLHAETAVGFLENTKWLLELKDSKAVGRGDFAC